MQILGKSRNIRRIKLHHRRISDQLLRLADNGAVDLHIAVGIRILDDVAVLVERFGFDMQAFRIKDRSIRIGFGDNVIRAVGRSVNRDLHGGRNRRSVLDLDVSRADNVAAGNREGINAFFKRRTKRNGIAGSENFDGIALIPDNRAFGKGGQLCRKAERIDRLYRVAHIGRFVAALQGVFFGIQRERKIG